MLLIGSTDKELTVAQIYDKYRKDAKRRGHEWGLSRQQVEDIIFSNCVYCNASPSNQQGKFSAKTIRSNGSRMGTVLYSGIDRMDNTRGYEPDNCVSSCGNCNRAKHSMPYDQWISWLNRIGVMWG